MEDDRKGGMTVWGWTNPRWVVVASTWTKVEDKIKGWAHSQRELTTKNGYNNFTSSFNNSLQVGRRSSYKLREGLPSNNTKMRDTPTKSQSIFLEA